MPAKRLLPQPIRDRREPDETMQGLPLARATSPDGRWAYTLYLKPGGETFVHALDTKRRAAWCVDLETTFAATDALPTHALVLAPDGHTLEIERDDGRVTELVDTATLEARLPNPAADEGPIGWIARAVAAALAAANGA